MLAPVSALVVFDLDGTLVDSARDIHASLAYALEQVRDGHESTEADEAALREGIHGQPLEPFFRRARPRATADAMPRFIKAYRAHYHDHLLDYTRPFKGVEDGLHALGQLRSEFQALHPEHSLRLAVATTKLTLTARRVVTELGLHPHFDFVLGSDGLPTKPDPAVLYAVFAQLGKPSWSLMVGDTDYDILAGRAAGMRTCAVGWSELPHERLAAAQPDHHLHEFAEVVSLVRRSLLGDR